MLRIRPFLGALLGAVAAAFTPNDPVGRLVNAAKRGRDGVRNLLRQNPTAENPRKRAGFSFHFNPTPTFDKMLAAEQRNLALSMCAGHRRKRSVRLDAERVAAFAGVSVEQAKAALGLA